MINNIYIIIYIITEFVCLAMLYFLWRQTKKTDSSRALIWLIFITTIWTGVEILASMGSIINETAHLYLWRAAFFFGGLTTYSLLCFVLTFFGICKKINFKIKISIGFVLSVVSFYLMVISSGTVKNILADRSIWEIGYTTGNWFPLTVLIVGLPMFLSLVFTLWKCITAENIEDRKRFGIMALGISFPTLGGSLTNLILPLLGIVHFPRLANLSSVALIGVLFYIIYELNAFRDDVKRYSIRFRLVVMIVMTTFFGSVAGFFIYYSDSLKVINQEIYRNFDSISQTKAYEVQSFLDFQREKLSLTIKSSIVIGELFNKTQQDEEYFVILKKVKDKLNLISDKEIKDVILLDKNGQVIAVSKNNQEEGKDYSQNEIYTKALNKEFISGIKKEENSDNYYFTISVPFFDAQKNKFQGMIIGKIDTGVLEKLLVEKIDLGNTGEIFLVNGEKYLITPAKYLSRENILKTKIETINTQNCFLDREDSTSHTNHEIVNIFSDYRNVQVLGAHVYMPQMDWCLVSKIDQREISNRYEKGLSIRFFISLFIILGISGLVAYFYSLTISRPVNSLRDGADEISEGNLDYKVKISYRDEFGQLAQAFNLMSEKLKQSYVTLENKIKERTNELEVAILEMRDSRKAMLNILEDVEDEKEKSEALARDLEKFNLAVENASDQIMILDSNGTILYANQAMEKITGFKLRDIIGKKIESKELGGDVKKKDFYKKILDQIKLDKKSFSGEITNIRKDGESYVALVSISPILDEKEEVRFFVDIERDISEQKMAEEQIRKILNDLQERSQSLNMEKLKSDALLANIGDGIVATDQDGNITIVNDSIEKLLGWSRKELVNRSSIEALNLFYKDLKEVPISKRPMVLALSTGEKSSTPLGETYYYKRKDGSIFPAGITVTPFVLNGKIVGTVSIIRDITIEKNIDQAKTEFVSLASHQLRTPLTSINWYSEMILSEDAGRINKTQKEYAKTIWDSSQRMTELVNSLLNVSRLELGTFIIEPKPMEMVAVAEDVLKELTVKILEKKMKINKIYKPKEINLNADSKLLRIVFQNLFSNAVKYTPENGTVGIKIEKKSKEFYIEVSDTGYGIPEKDQAFIFGKLFRADNVRQKEMEGTGLGLYIVKTIIENAGGKTWFKSVENKGTTFYVTLPLSGMLKKEGSKPLG